MYCSKCGQFNPEGESFCTGCGQPLQAATKKAKEKNNVIGIVIKIVAITVAVLGATIAGLRGEEKLPDIEDDGVVSQAYMQVFEDHGLTVPESDFVNSDMKAAAYALDYDSGMFETMEFVYSNGRIFDMVNAIYIPVDGLNQTEKYELDASIRENLAPLESVKCCVLELERGPQYYVYKLYYEDLQYQNNIQEMMEAGIVERGPNGETPEIISIKETEDDLLAQGYVKR